MTTLESSECLPGKLRIPHDGTYVTITVYISLEAFRYPSRTSKHVHMCTSSWKSQGNQGKSTQTATYTSAVALVN